MLYPTGCAVCEQEFAADMDEQTDLCPTCDRYVCPVCWPEHED